MPTNYPVLVFANEPGTFDYRPLDAREPAELFAPEREFEYGTVHPLDDAYCKRESCRADRRRAGVVDRKELATLWTDVFRLKHNSRREDHPTMLPPKLVRRLLRPFTDPGDAVLDPFNGVRTAALAAAQLDCRYTGCERSERYVEIAREKSDQLDRGVPVRDGLGQHRAAAARRHRLRGGPRRTSGSRSSGSRRSWGTSPTARRSPSGAATRSTTTTTTSTAGRTPRRRPGRRDDRGPGRRVARGGPVGVWMESFAHRKSRRPVCRAGLRHRPGVTAKHCPETSMSPPRTLRTSPATRPSRWTVLAVGRR